MAGTMGFTLHEGHELLGGVVVASACGVMTHGRGMGLLACIYEVDEGGLCCVICRAMLGAACDDSTLFGLATASAC